MGISKKGKRRLVYQDTDFFWFMKFTDDWMHAYIAPQLHIVSSDKELILSYQPGQKNENPFIIVKKGIVSGLNESTGSWKRIKVPNWDDGEITPGFVRTLLEWWFDEKKTLILVDFLGAIVSD